MAKILIILRSRKKERRLGRKRKRGSKRGLNTVEQKDAAMMQRVLKNSAERERMLSRVRPIDP